MAEDATQSAVDAAHGGGGAGMPQLDFSTFPNQIFWLLVTLLAIYLILTRVALPRLGSVIAERQGTLTNDLAAAEDLKRQAADAEEAYNQALVAARAEAQKIADATRAEIQEDLAEAIARADDEISAKASESESRIGEIQASAAESVRDVARDVAAEIVRAFAPGQDVDTDAVASAVANRIGG